MGNNVIGFIGCDKYELILYLSRILYHMGKQVLLVDYSESKALSQCIPIPDDLKEEACSIDYRGVDFIQGKFFNSSMSEKYNVVLMDLGFGLKEEKQFCWSKIFYVTDLQMHNVKRLCNVDYVQNINKYLVIKDVLPCKIKPEYIQTIFDEVIDKESIYILYQDTLDLKYKVLSQYNYIFTFNRLSESVQYFLKDIVKQIDNEIDEKELKQAYRKAERGK